MYLRGADWATFSTCQTRVWLSLTSDWCCLKVTVKLCGFTDGFCFNVAALAFVTDFCNLACFEMSVSLIADMQVILLFCCMQPIRSIVSFRRWSPLTSLSFIVGPLFLILHVTAVTWPDLTHVLKVTLKPLKKCSGNIQKDLQDLIKSCLMTRGLRY